MGIIHQIRRVDDKPARKSGTKDRPAEKIKAGLTEALAVARGEAEPAAIHVRRGRPKTGNAKELITLRLDPDVLASYRATGDGWQARINADLRKARGL